MVWYYFLLQSTKFMSICNKPNLALYLLHSAIFSYGTWNNHIQMMLEKLNISMAVPLSSNPMHARHEVTVPSIRSTFGMLKSSLVTVNILVNKTLFKWSIKCCIWYFSLSFKVHRADPRMANETKYQNKNFFDHLNSIVRRFSIFERSDPDEPSYPFVRNSLPRGHLFGAIHQADPGLANILFANQ